MFPEHLKNVRKVFKELDLVEFQNKTFFSRNMSTNLHSWA
jgi:hypothetical protein